MGIIWRKISEVSLRNKLAIGFTASFLLLLGTSFYAIFELSARYRKDEFYQRLIDRTLTIYKLMIEVEQIDHDMLRLLDRNTINSLYEEKVLLFDSSFHLIYKSIDDTKVPYSASLLRKLKNGTEEEIRMSDGRYETVGLRYKHNGIVYYGISKAYDRFGRSKLEFLRWVLIGTFVISAILLILLSFYLSSFITRPVSVLTSEIEKISAHDLSIRVHSPSARDEIGFLADKFNELLDRVERAFKFQYHFINHLSHELKTPLAILMANTDRALTENNIDIYKASLLFQQQGLMELSHIMNAMLDISRSETQPEAVRLENIRIDELLFECMDEIRVLKNSVHFEFSMDEDLASSEQLTVKGNGRMLKMAIMNLLKNAVNYSNDKHPHVHLASGKDEVILKVTNNGQTLTSEEQERLFRHLFRGSNSSMVKGFGLGLVLTQRIIALHRAHIRYVITEDGENCFSLFLPTIS